MYIRQVGIYDHLTFVSYAYIHPLLDSLSTYSDMTLEESFSSTFHPRCQNKVNGFANYCLCYL